MAFDLNTTFVAFNVIAAPVAAIVGAFLGGPRTADRIKWGAFCLLIWPMVFLLIARRLRGQPADAAAATAPDMGAASGAGQARTPPQPVRPVGTSDIAAIPEPVSACPDCGFLGIRPPGIQDGVAIGGGELIFQVCPRCGYRGVPVEFARREDYAAFVGELSNGA